MNTFDLSDLLSTKAPEAYNGFGGSLIQYYKNTTKNAVELINAFLRENGYILIFKHNIEQNYAYYYQKENCLIYFYLSAAENTVRVIYETNRKLPAFTPQSVTALTQNRFWQYEIDHSLIDCGMCYILQLTDHRYILIDSGHFYSVADPTRLYLFLRERTPDHMPVTVAAWFFTHGHVDHIATYMALTQEHKDVVVEGLYYNFVPDEHPDAENWMDSDRNHTRQFVERTLCGSVPVYHPHSFMKFFVGDIAVEVLCTYEDVLEHSLKDYNDSSLVFKLTVGTDTVLIPGDASGEESKILEARTPDSLSCDILQQAHHGHFGTSEHFYRLANATVLLCPSTKIKYDEEYTRYKANQTAEHIARHLFIASDGTVEFTFPLSDSEIVCYPDETLENFNGIYNLWSYSYTEPFKQELRKRFAENGKKRVIPY